MVTYGTNPGMGIPITSHVPSPDEQADPGQRRALERALEYMDLQPGQAILGQKVDVVFVGSCTNGRISDLRLAAGVLKDRHVADGVRLMVVPGSDEVKREAEAEGLAEIFKAAGAEWREAGCSMCIAMNGDQLSPGQYAVSTSNRNFEGRQGKGGRTFLASPLTAAASAIAGVVADPRRLPGHRDPRRGRGPLSMAEPFTMFTSKAVPLPAENVDTDQIVPARYLKVTDKNGLAEALFRDWRFEEDGSLKEPRFVLDRPEMAGREILRRRRQLRGRVVARARAVGAVRLGHPGHPLDVVRRHLQEQQPQERRPADHRRCRRRTPACSSSWRRTRTPSSRSISPNRASCCRTARTIDFDIDPFAKRMILAGTDELGYLLSKEPEIAAWEARHPRPHRFAGGRGLSRRRRID